MNYLEKLAEECEMLVAADSTACVYLAWENPQMNDSLLFGAVGVIPQSTSRPSEAVVIQDLENTDVVWDYPWGCPTQIVTFDAPCDPQLEFLIAPHRNEPWFNVDMPSLASWNSTLNAWCLHHVGMNSSEWLLKFYELQAQIQEYREELRELA